MVEQFEKGPDTHGEEVQNLDVLQIIHILPKTPTQKQDGSVFVVVNEKNLTATITDVLKKGMGRQMEIAFDKINANMEKIILLIQLMA